MSIGGDALFPFPEPTFLFIHNVLLLTAGAVTTDDRGRPTRTYAQSTVKGYLTAPDVQALVGDGALRESVSAVLLVPRTVVVRTEDRIEGTDTAIPANLRGRYEVVGIRPTLAHTRVLLRRFTGVWAV